MTLRPGETPGRAVAVFPFLKTSDALSLGRFTFRSTDDTAGLDAADAAHVREIADMLFLQDDLRIRSAAYAMLPTLDLDKEEPSLRELERIQAIVAFCYSHPHPTSGDPFLRFEHSSLAVFSPEPVSIFVARPEHHVTATDPDVKLEEDEWHRVPGYHGRYNFRHPFWVVKGSRLHPPVPSIWLNDSQNLTYDLGDFFQSPRYHLLPALLAEPDSATADRVLTALRWFNRANAIHIDDDSAIINLSVAFETLLALPKDAKTDRFVDAVSLLLGRVERLDVWAEQFYDARSDVIHQGRTRRLRFEPQKKKGQPESALYQSHLAYGRQIFQVCVGAVVFGQSLSKGAGIAEKLVTNQERLESIRKTLDDETLTPAERIAAIKETVALIDRFRFVGETGLLIKTLVGAVQSTAGTLLLCSDTLDPVLMQRVEALANAPRSDDCYAALAALKDLHDLRAAPPSDAQSPVAITLRLAEVVWYYTGMRYFGLTEERKKNPGQK